MQVFHPAENMLEKAHNSQCFLHYLSEKKNKNGKINRPVCILFLKIVFASPNMYYITLYLTLPHLLHIRCKIIQNSKFLEALV